MIDPLKYLLSAGSPVAAAAAAEALAARAARNPLSLSLARLYMGACRGAAPAGGAAGGRLNGGKTGRGRGAGGPGSLGRIARQRCARRYPAAGRAAELRRRGSVGTGGAVSF